MTIESPFKHPWWVPYRNQGNSARYLDEWLIIGLSDTIRSKPDWERKYIDPVIVKKWKSEFLAQKPETKYANEVFDYVVQELKWYDAMQSRPELEGREFKFGPDDRILYSDKAVPEEVSEEFFLLAEEFELSIHEKDYHPGSNNQVLDLVHPSLFHLVYGKTKILKDGKLEVAEFDEETTVAKKGVSDYGISKQFQWLPALMKLDKDSKSFEFASYINNLHPLKNEALYTSIADIFNLIIPGLNMCLSRYQSEEYLRIPIADWDKMYLEGYEEFEEELDELLDKILDEDGDMAEYEALKEKKKEFYQFHPPKYEKDPETKFLDIRSFKDLKVIVKLANIELTPECPEYKGGSWHVEGTINEDIVATVLYYYDVYNIEDSRLSFRHAFEDPNYEQGDLEYCRDFFGVEDGDPMTRYLGNIRAQKDRVIIFPNTYQHHVDAFKLKDPSKAGYRKILCFFLVDPYNTVVKATDAVPPQNEAWVKDKKLMEKYFPGVDAKDIVTMTEEEAKEKRLELMKERTVIETEEGDFDNVFTRKFSLCEH